MVVTCENNDSLISHQIMAKIVENGVIQKKYERNRIETAN